jgi:hypothetical protein
MIKLAVRVCELIYTRQEHQDTRASPDEAAWQNIVIPYSRLTRPSEDLSTELWDCPLLLLFRFLRFRNCYVTDEHGADPLRLVEVPLNVYLVGQVVAYRSSERCTFVIWAGATLRPTSKYICVVAVRQPPAT